MQIPIQRAAAARPARTQGRPAPTALGPTALGPTALGPTALGPTALAATLLALVSGACVASDTKAVELPPLDAPAAPVSTARITLEQTVGRGKRIDWDGDLERWRWADDGVHLVRGSGKDAVTLDARTLEPVVQPATPAEAAAEGGAAADAGTSPDGRRDDAARALAALLGVDADAAARLARHPVGSTADDSVQAFDVDGALIVQRMGEDAKVALESTGADLELFDLSPDRQRLDFVREGDLFVLSFSDGAVVAVTGDASFEQLDGKLDWVYQEEVYGRGDFSSAWWSPDSAHVAFLSLDETPVHEFTVVDHIVDGNFHVLPEVTRYPEAGDPNPNVRIGLYDAEREERVWVDLSRFADFEPIVVRVGWTPDGKTLLYVVQDRIQSWADLVAYDIASGVQKTWIHEVSDTWVDRPELPRWLDDGTFLWLSERTGYRHVYHYRQGGELIRTLTEGPWEVRNILRIDQDAGTLWFTASRDGAIDQNAYSVPLAGGEIVRLTDGPGTHRIEANGDGTLILDRVSRRTRPPEYRLCDGRTGAVISVLARSPEPDPDTPPLARWELHEVPARDGFPLDVAVLKPHDFDPGKRYPVWLATYSGPDAPTIRNTWRPSTWYQFLAQEGVIVLNVNVRTASGKGQALTSLCYRQLGVQELADIEDAVDWLTKNRWADGDRVGITGWSYGGFMTAYALTHSDRFALGIAGAGVYDWHMYDTIYTERYMQRPVDNPDGYAATSVLRAAGNLKGHLLLLHGTKDDNVHLQNTIQLIEALQLADKDFELMLYPESRHGVGSPAQRWEMRKLEWRTIQTWLKPEGSPPVPPTAPASS